VYCSNARSAPEGTQDRRAAIPIEDARLTIEDGGRYIEVARLTIEDGGRYIEVARVMIEIAAITIEDAAAAIVDGGWECISGAPLPTIAAAPGAAPGATSS